MKNKAKQIIAALQDKGFEAYLVGGCVRDELMGFIPHDYDIATNALPEQVEALFEKTVPVGKSFGVINVLVEGDTFQVATFRKDSLDSDGRRPNSVEFSDAEQDAQRRDFTINGLFFDPLNNKLYDYVGGQLDIQFKRLRFIGDPAARIKEDHLRILRYFRFLFRFDFAADYNSMQACIQNMNTLDNVSSERIRDELTKILSHENACEAFHGMHHRGVWRVVLPEVEELFGCEQEPCWHPEGDVGNHTALMLKLAGERLNDNPILAWAIVLHDIAKPNTFARNSEGRITAHGHADVGAKMARDILNRLKFDGQFIDEVVWIVENHMKLHDADKMKLSTRKKLYRKEYFERLLELNRLDCLGSHAKLDGYNWLLADYLAMPKEVARPEPFIMGRDLIALGLKPCKGFKAILEELEVEQLENRLENKEAALEYARNLIAKLVAA